MCIPVYLLVFDVTWIRKLLQVHAGLGNSFIQHQIHQGTVNQILEVDKSEVEISLLAEAV